MTSRIIVATVVAVLMMACGGQNADTADVPPQMLEGRIRVAGTDPAPMVMLAPISGGAEVQLTGSLASEIGRLSGLTISVNGAMHGEGMRGLEVSSYQITAVGGRRPAVGTLVRRDGDLWLDGETVVRLVNVPAGLRTRVGAKIWVVGTEVDGTLQLESYGVIAEPDG